MLRIRQEQVDTFAEAQQVQFDREVLAFLRTEFPERFAIVGEKAVKETIARGKADAVTRRLTAKRDVSRYIALMFALGVDFDTKEPPRWVLLILSRRAPASERLDRIYDRIVRAGDA